MSSWNKVSRLIIDLTDNVLWSNVNSYSKKEPISKTSSLYQYCLKLYQNEKFRNEGRTFLTEISLSGTNYKYRCYSKFFATDSNSYEVFLWGNINEEQYLIVVRLVNDNAPWYFLKKI